jgi:hypothetical protein
MLFFSLENPCISNISGFSSHNSFISGNKNCENSVLVMSETDLRQIVIGEKAENTVIGGPTSNNRALRNHSISNIQQIYYSGKISSLLKQNIITGSNKVNRSPLSEILRI